LNREEMDAPNGHPPDRPVVGVDRIDGSVVVHLAGELDIYNAPAVRDALFEAAAGDPARLVVDLEAVDFVDSTALGVLIEVRTKQAQRHNAFLLAAPGLETYRALQVSGLDKHLRVHETVAAALSAPVA
jgi:anti-sigma B factor antagonist